MVRVIFFGTPNFVLPILDTLGVMGPDIELVAVVTTPDKPVGRKHIITSSPVKTWAQAHDVMVLQPEKLDDIFVVKLQGLQPTVGVMAAFGKIVPKTVLDVFSGGVLNIHPSLLPRWRGSSPVQAAIAAGDMETGVTIMLTDAEMDHGPVLAQEKVLLLGDEVMGKLTEELFLQGADLFSKTLPLWVQGKLFLQPQDHAKATFTKLLSRDDGRIDWAQPADTIVRLVRAYDPWPATFTVLPDGTRLKVLQALKANREQEAPIGTVFQSDEGAFLVRAADGWVRLNAVQREGGSSMDGETFLRGQSSLLGEKLL